MPDNLNGTVSNLRTGFVVVHDCDVDSIVFIYSIGHLTKDPKEFKEDWKCALNAVKAADPEEWIVAEVITELENIGWIITRIDPIHVSY